MTHIQGVSQCAVSQNVTSVGVTEKESWLCLLTVEFILRQNTAPACDFRLPRVSGRLVNLSPVNYTTLYQCVYIVITLVLINGFTQTPLLGFILLLYR